MEGSNRPGHKKAYRSKGYNIRCIGFDEKTDLTLLAREIEETSKKLY